jgi:predicted transcriptional regulator
LTVAQELWNAKWEKQEKMLRQREYEVERMEANAKATAMETTTEMETTTDINRKKISFNVTGTGSSMPFWMAILKKRSEG